MQSHKTFSTFGPGLGFITLLLLSLFIYGQSGQWSEAKARKELLQLARIAAINLHPADLQELISHDNQPFPPAVSTELLRHLNLIRAADSVIQEVYLMGQLHGQVVFLADADNALGEGPFWGEIYPDASKALKQALKDGHPIVEGPLSDAWGTWISALVPIIDERNRQVIALLGLDIDERTWQKMVGQWQNLVGGVALLGLSLYLFLWLYVLRVNGSRTQLFVKNQQLIQENRERELAERQLLENKELWENALVGNDFNIWEWDLARDEFHFPGKSPAKKGEGKDRSTISMEAWQKLIHPNDLPKVLGAIEAHIANRTPHFKVEFRQQRKDGLCRWFVSRGQVSARDPDNRPTRLLGVYADITERKQFERRMLDDRQRLFELLDSLPALVYLVDANFVIRFANRRLRESLGIPGNTPCHQFLCLEDKPCRGCSPENLFEKGTTQVHRKRFANGHSYEVYHYPFRDLDGSPQVLVMALDLTERYDSKGSVDKYTKIFTNEGTIPRSKEETLQQNDPIQPTP